MKGTFHLFPQKTGGKRTKGARDIFLTGAFSYLPQQKKKEKKVHVRCSHHIPYTASRRKHCLSLCILLLFFSKPQNGDFSLTKSTQIVGCKEPQ